MRRIAAWLALFCIACSGSGDGETVTEPAPPSSAAAAANPSDAPVEPPPNVGDTETTPTGLEITHLVVGSGARPKASDVVEVHYHGTFPDGSVFDSSVERGQPARFPLRRVIRCWTEGVQKISVGGKARLVCPPGIAYGARGAPPRIPPNATLHFEVELLAIQ